MYLLLCFVVSLCMYVCVWLHFILHVCAFWPERASGLADCLEAIIKSIDRRYKVTLVLCILRSTNSLKEVTETIPTALTIAYGFTNGKIQNNISFELNLIVKFKA